MAPRLSIVIPVLNEAACVGHTLEALASLRQDDVEIIVVDGGSTDGTPTIAALCTDKLIFAPRGRAAQMNAGAAAARGDVLLFLHADTRLPLHAKTAIVDGLTRTRRVWGRFNVSIESGNRLLVVVAAMMNLRSRITGIATGDQAIFVTRRAFNDAGGFPDVPLMEDIALSRMLKARSRPLCLSDRVTTSARRWETHGTLRTIFLMWRLRLAFFLGAKPAALAREYGYAPYD